MDEGNSRPLHDAIDTEDVDIVRQCLDTGVDVDSMDINDHTALQYALEKCQNINVMTLLLDRGADVNKTNIIDQTPLHLAMTRRHRPTQVLHLLIDRGADLSMTDFKGLTPLHECIAMGTCEMVQVLLDRGADPDVQDDEGKTPLHHACIIRDAEFVKVLLSGKASVNIQDNDGETPLHTTVHRWNDNSPNIRRVMKQKTLVLLENGADVGALNDEGRTPLHRVAMSRGSHFDRNTEGMIMALLSWGASMAAQDNNEMTPVDLASCPESIDIETMIMHCWRLHCKLLRYVDIEVEPFLTSDVIYDFDSDLFFEDDALSLELQKLKNTKFGANSLYDVLAMAHDPSFIFNNELEQGVKSLDSDSEFNFYGSLLKATFVNSKIRWPLLNDAQDVFDIPVPVEMKRMILSFLPCKDLRNVITCYKK